MTGFKKMVKLDFYTMKSQVLAYLSLILIVIMFGFMEASITLLCITGAWFIALMSSSIFAVQEKNNLNRLYGSLSVHLKDIVLGRYVFVFLNYLLSLFIVNVLYLFFILFQGKKIEAYELLLAFSISLLVFSLITGVQMPLFFKMGYTKGRYWSMVPFIAVMILITVPNYVTALSELVKFFMDNQGILIIAGIIASALIQYVSYQISMIEYRKHR